MDEETPQVQKHDEQRLLVKQRRGSYEPYRHQISGHFPMLWHRGTILKPVIGREPVFYQDLLAYCPQLCSFVPRFLGVETLTLEQVHQRCGDLETVSDSPSGGSAYSSSSPSQNAKTVSGHSRRWHDKPPKAGTALQSLKSNLPPIVDDDARVNLVLTGVPLLTAYMILEDLTSKYDRPSILDLKLGQRHWGLDASPEKIARKAERARTTTSHSLGIRLGGMQLYNNDTETFDYLDKYAGRDLNEKEFRSHVRAFLRRSPRESFLVRVRELCTALAQLDGFRFFTSSLLLIYDGRRQSNGVVEVRLIDFAHTYYRPDDPEFQGPDQGVLLGLTTLLEVIAAAEQEMPDAQT